jgi:hypothetical protein
MLKIMCGPERFQVVFLEHEFACLVNNIYHVRVMLVAICWAIVVWKSICAQMKRFLE